MAEQFIVSLIRKPNIYIEISARSTDSMFAWRQRRKYFFRYSKWHRLNQEVGKTTKKNKLDKNPYFCYFDASRRLTTARPLGARIENKQRIYSKRSSRNFMWM